MLPFVYKALYCDKEAKNRIIEVIEYNENIGRLSLRNLSMTIHIEELDNMDFSDVADGKKLLPIHPGEILREEFLKPMNITPHGLSLALQIPATRINNIVLERRAISVDTALRLAKYFGNTAEFWMGLQIDYDMTIARESLRDALNRIQQITPAPVETL